MKTLFKIDLKDYDENAPRFERPSVRGIILKKRKIALVHSLKYDYYKFPGGGCKKNENHRTTLIREVQEETGLVVIPSSIKEFGMVHRIQKGDLGSAFVQDNFYYFCNAENEIQKQSLDDYEDKEKFTLEFVTAEQAINVNKNHHHAEMQNDIFYKTMIERETMVLEMIQKELKTLYVSDLDGTLLNSNEKLSGFTLQTINALVEKGMFFTYATARSLESASKVTAGLSSDIPIIAYNGTFIFESSTRKILHSVFFTKEEQNRIIEILKNNHIFPIVYAFVNGEEKLSWLLSMKNPGIQRYINHRKGDKRLRPVKDNNQLFEGDIFYFTCIGTKEELAKVYSQLLENQNGFRVTFQNELYCANEYWLEIMNEKATKAQGILKLKELLNCEKIVSFGDAVNDIPMFRISDECYAVENAVEELKKIATAVIPCNNDDGIAKWLAQNAL